MARITRLLGSFADRLVPKVEAQAACGSWYTLGGCPCNGSRQLGKLCWSCSDGSTGCSGCAYDMGPCY